MSASEPWDQLALGNSPSAKINRKLGFFVESEPAIVASAVTIYGNVDSDREMGTGTW